MRTRWLCLDFTQTVGWEAADRADDALTDYGALVAWVEAKGTVSSPEAESLRAQALAHPGAAARVLARAIELRRAIYRVFAAIGSGGRPAPADLARLNEFLPDALKHLRLEQAPNATIGAAVAGGSTASETEAIPWTGDDQTQAPVAAMYRLGWVPVAGAEALWRPVWSVARSAAELLTSPELERLRLCEADDCGWLFVDASRNRSRRWCDMAGCGNLAKVRRFRARRRGLA